MSEQALSMAAWAVVAATISGDVTPRCGRDGQDQPNRDMAAKRTIELSARRGRHWRHRASAKAGTDLGGKQEKRITTRNKTKIDCSAGRSTNPTESNTAVLISRLRRQHKAEPAPRAGEDGELCRGPQSSRSHFCGDEASQGLLESQDEQGTLKDATATTGQQPATTTTPPNTDQSSFSLVESSLFCSIYWAACGQDPFLRKKNTCK